MSCFNFTPDFLTNDFFEKKKNKKKTTRITYSLLFYILDWIILVCFYGAMLLNGFSLKLVFDSQNAAKFLSISSSFLLINSIEADLPHLETELCVCLNFHVSFAHFDYLQFWFSFCWTWLLNHHDSFFG